MTTVREGASDTERPNIFPHHFDKWQLFWPSRFLRHFDGDYRRMPMIGWQLLLWSIKADEREIIYGSRPRAAEQIIINSVLSRN